MGHQHEKEEEGKQNESEKKEDDKQTLTEKIQKDEKDKKKEVAVEEKPTKKKKKRKVKKKRKKRPVPFSASGFFRSMVNKLTGDDDAKKRNRRGIEETAARDRPRGRVLRRSHRTAPTHIPRRAVMEENRPAGHPDKMRKLM